MSDWEAAVGGLLSMGKGPGMSRFVRLFVFAVLWGLVLGTVVVPAEAGSPVDVAPSTSEGADPGGPEDPSEDPTESQEGLGLHPEGDDDAELYCADLIVHAARSKEPDGGYDFLMKQLDPVDPING